MRALVSLIKRGLTQSLWQNGRPAQSRAAKVRSRPRLEIEQLEALMLPTTLSLTVGAASVQTLVASLPGTSGWFQANLSDANTRALAQKDFTRDGSLTRADMLGLFTEVEADGVVSVSELKDLKVLIANGSSLKMPDSVRYLADKVVNGDPANFDYQSIQTIPGAVRLVGGHLQAGPAISYEVEQPLGDLYAGSSSTQLQDLVNKWFYGMDVPNTTLLNTNGTISASYNYAYDSAASLFGSGISYTDIHQGAAGDCWLMAAMTDLAKQSPATLKGLFTDNGDGTFTVRIDSQTNSTPMYVTVNRWLPVDSNGNMAFDGLASITNSKVNLWGPLLEKAYIQANQDGMIGRTMNDSYQALNIGNPGVAMQQLTGLSASIANTLTQNAFTNAVTGGYLVTLLSQGSAGGSLNTVGGNTYVPNHEYAVLGYNASTKKFDLFNPWGQNTSGKATTEMSVTWSAISKEFLSFDQGTNPAQKLTNRINSAPLATLIALGGGSAGQTVADGQTFSATPPVPRDESAPLPPAVDQFYRELANQPAELALRGESVVYWLRQRQASPEVAEALALTSSPGGF